MTGFRTNARAVAAIFADRSKQWDGALKRAMRKAITTVEVRATVRLSGSGAAGNYPIPVRTGDLRRSLGSQMTSATSGIVFNDAGYAHALHAGRIAVGYKGRGRKSVTARPFLDDAMKDANPGGIVLQMMSAAL